MKILPLLLLSVTCLPSRSVVAEDIRDKIADAQARLSNLKISYECTTTQTPDLELVRKNFGEGRAKYAVVGTESADCDFTFLSGAAFYKWKIVKSYHNPVMPGEVAEHQEVFDLARCETVTRTFGGRLTGEILDHGNLPTYPIIDVALGLHPYRESKILQSDDWKKMTLERTTPDEVTVSRVDGSGELDRWTFSNTQPMGLLSYTISDNTGFKIFEFANDLQDQESMRLPKHVVFRRFSHADNKVREVIKTELNVKKVTVNDPKLTAQDFTITWPKGTMLVDQRSMLTVKVTSKDRTLSDDDLAQVLKQQAEAQKNTTLPSN